MWKSQNNEIPHGGGGGRSTNLYLVQTYSTSKGNKNTFSTDRTQLDAWSFILHWTSRVGLPYVCFSPPSAEHYWLELILIIVHFDKMSSEDADNQKNQNKQKKSIKMVNVIVKATGEQFHPTITTLFYLWVVLPMRRMIIITIIIIIILLSDTFKLWEHEKADWRTVQMGGAADGVFQRESGDHPEGRWWGRGIEMGFGGRSEQRWNVFYFYFFVFFPQFPRCSS